MQSRLMSTRQPWSTRQPCCAGLVQRISHARLPVREPFRGVMARAAPLKVNQEELEVAIGNRDRPMVVDFYATWCGPCLLLAKELEKVAADMDGKVQVLKVDVDENPQLSTQLQIQGLPTMIFIGMDPDKPALRTEGLLPADTIKRIITDELK